MQIKICGITSLADAQCAVDAGTDLLGFVFYPKSPRYVPPDTARTIIKALPETIEAVGVFVNEANTMMREIAARVNLKALQLHGDEASEQVRDLIATGMSVIKAVAIHNEAGLDRLRDFPGCRMLIDTPSPKYGGTGNTGDWDLAREASARHDIFLAGGLTPENVAAAIAHVHPAGIDVSSGVERAKGLKDHQKVRSFINTARQAS